MDHLTEKLTSAGYGITNHIIAADRIKQWERHLGASPKVSPFMPPTTHPDALKVDDFVLKKTEMLVIELLSRSHTDLVILTKEVKDAFHVHMTTPRITTLIYRAIKEAGEADGMVSSRHREMVKSGSFSTNAVARVYAVALPAIQKGARHSILSAFAQAVKLHGAALATWKPAPIPVKITPPSPSEKSVGGLKKSPAKNAGDWDFYDR